jgi:hypothetical protein
MTRPNHTAVARVVVLKHMTNESLALIQNRSIAEKITPTDTTQALSLVGIADADINLG